jgi:hypothetical protein
LKTLIIAVLLLGLGIAYWLIPGSNTIADPGSAEPPNRPDQVQSLPEAPAEESGRVPLQEDLIPLPESESAMSLEDASQLLANCLETSDPIACLIAIPDLILSVEFFASQMAAVTRPQAAQLACVFLLKSDPTEVFVQYSALFRDAHAKNQKVDDMVMERGFNMAIRRDQEWQGEVAKLVSSSSIHGPELTDIGVIMAASLAVAGNTEIAEVLRSGFEAESDATEMQKIRTVGWLSVLASNPIDRHLEFARILSSIPADAPSEAAEMVGILLLRKKSFPGGDALPNIQLVDRVLSNPNWGPNLARQIAADYPSSPPQGITDQQWQTILRGVERWQ